VREPGNGHPDQRKAPIAASVTNVRRWGYALFNEPTPLAAFRSLDVPVLYMIGGRSTPAAHGVAQLLTKALPRVEVVEFEGLGHMGPITHPEVVNRAIADFSAGPDSGSDSAAAVSLNRRLAPCYRCHRVIQGDRRHVKRRQGRELFQARTLGTLGGLAGAALLPGTSAFAQPKGKPIRIGFQVHKTGIGATYGKWYERTTTGRGQADQRQGRNRRQAGRDRRGGRRH
jgi:hypothetical protein